MNKKFKYEIIMGLVFVFGFMLTATFVFAKDKEPEIKKINYRVQSNPKYNYIEKEISLSKSIEKTVSKNNETYKLSVSNGNVILTNTKTNRGRVVYSNGDARGLAEINYYYYDATYIVIVTNKGELYANVYKNNEADVYFRKVKLNNTINKLKVVEKELKFYEHPSIELFGLDDEDNWELIKL